MEQVIEQAVTVMRERYEERLYVPDLAAAAYLSPFHFSRVFRRETGISPGRYLTAVRMFEAKRLLSTSSFSVADIACRVGYPGVGTFTTRFTKLVGVSPGHYRRLPVDGMVGVSGGVATLPAGALVATRNYCEERKNAGSAVVVSVEPADCGLIDRIFVGVFGEGVPQGFPIAWTLVTGRDSGQVRLNGLPTGRRVVVAVAEGVSPAGSRPPTLVCECAVELTPDAVARVELHPHRPKRTDPPIMVPLVVGGIATRAVAT